MSSTISDGTIADDTTVSMSSIISDGTIAYDTTVSMSSIIYDGTVTRHSRGYEQHCSDDQRRIFSISGIIASPR
jgi:hypothetical protein